MSNWKDAGLQSLGFGCLGWGFNTAIPAESLLAAVTLLLLITSLIPRTKPIRLSLLKLTLIAAVMTYLFKLFS